jgi:flagellar biosynthesis component FlhA
MIYIIRRSARVAEIVVQFIFASISKELSREAAYNSGNMSEEAAFVKKKALQEKGALLGELYGIASKFKLFKIDEIAQ